MGTEAIKTTFHSLSGLGIGGTISLLIYNLLVNNVFNRLQALRYSIYIAGLILVRSLTGLNFIDFFSRLPSSTSAPQFKEIASSDSPDSYERKTIFLYNNENGQVGPPIIVRDPHKQAKSSDIYMQTYKKEVGPDKWEKLKYRQTGFWKNFQKEHLLGEEEETVIRIQRVESGYVPLNKRTKTLADIRREDSTENMKAAEPYIERYQTRRAKIHEKKNSL